MTATAHALIGGAIAVSIQNPALGIALSTASHPIADMVPHWDFGWGWRQKTKLKLFTQASADLLLGTLFAYLIFVQSGFFGSNINLPYFFACIFASELWDILETPYWFLGWKFPPFNWIYKFQSKIQGKAKLPWGILTQVVAISLVILVLQIFVS